MDWIKLLAPLALIALKIVEHFLSQYREQKAYGDTPMARRKNFDQALSEENIGDLNRRFDDLNIRIRMHGFKTSAASRARTISDYSQTS